MGKLIKKRGMTYQLEELSDKLANHIVEATKAASPVLDLGLEARDVLAGAYRSQVDFPAPVVNFYKAYHDRMLAQFTSIDASLVVEPRDNIDDTIPQDEANELAIVINRQMRSALTLSNMRNLVIRLGTDIINYGNGLIVITGHNDKKKLNHIYFPDIFIDPRADVVDLNTSRYLIYRVFVDRNDVADTYNIDIEDVPTLGGNRVGYGMIGLSSSSFSGAPRSITDGSGNIEITSYSFGNTTITDLDTDLSNTVDLYFGYIMGKNGWEQVIFLNQDEPVILSYTPYPYSILPAVLARINEVPGSYLGYPLWKDVRTWHNWKNWHYARVARKLAFNADPTPLIHQDEAIDPATSKPREYVFTPGNPMYFKNTPPAYLPQPPLDTETYTMMDRSTYDVEKSIGINDMSLGIGKETGSRTATEAEGLQAQSDIRLNGVIVSYLQALTNVGEILGIMSLTDNGYDVDQYQYVMDYDTIVTPRNAYERQKELANITKSVQAIAQLQQLLATNPALAQLAADLSGNKSLLSKFVPEESAVARDKAQVVDGNTLPQMPPPVFDGAASQQPV